MEFSKIKIMKKYILLLLPTLLGILGGYLYYYFIGCNQGCAITSNPYSSMIYGGIFGLLFTNFKISRKADEKK